MADLPKRSLVKTLSYRMTGSLVTSATIFAFTQRLTLAVGVGFFDLVLKLLCYYLHERLWDRIAWGQNRPAVEAVVKASDTSF